MLTVWKTSWSPVQNYDVPFSWYSSPDQEQKDELTKSEITTGKESNSSAMEQGDEKGIYENENKDPTYENSIDPSQPPPVPKRNIPISYQPKLPPRQNHLAKSNPDMIKNGAQLELENRSQSNC